LGADRLFAPTPGRISFFPELDRFVKVVEKEAEFPSFVVGEAESKRLLRLFVAIDKDAMRWREVQTLNPKGFLAWPYDYWPRIELE